MGLAYEIVINSNPCIAYLMEENTMTMQALVVAHACYGHNSFFKNNYLYRTWTDATSIIDYLVFAKQYMSQCEERHGVEEVEKMLDSCHALMNYGVDRYKRPHPVSPEEERRRQRERAEYIQRNLNDLWRTVPRAREHERARRRAVPEGSARESAVLHREERAAARTMATRDRAHRPQDRAVLLSAAPDAGDERRVGDVLALHAAERAVRRRQGDRQRS